MGAPATDPVKARKLMMSAGLLIPGYTQKEVGPQSRNRKYECKAIREAHQEWLDLT